MWIAPHDLARFSIGCPRSIAILKGWGTYVGPITPLALPTNLIAGSSRYAYGRFLLFDVLGELVWIALYAGLGYAFADQWETASDVAGNLTGALIGLLAFVVGGALAYRARRHHILAGHDADPSAG